MFYLIQSALSFKSSEPLNLTILLSLAIEPWSTQQVIHIIWHSMTLLHNLFIYCHTTTKCAFSPPSPALKPFPPSPSSNMDTGLSLYLCPCLHQVHSSEWTQWRHHLTRVICCRQLSSVLDTLHPPHTLPMPSPLSADRNPTYRSPAWCPFTRVTDPWGAGQAQEECYAHFSYRRKAELFGPIFPRNSWGVKTGVHNCAHAIFNINGCYWVYWYTKVY